MRFLVINLVIISIASWSHAFSFDGWQPGYPIDTVCRIGEQRSLLYLYTTDGGLGRASVMESTKRKNKRLNCEKLGKVEKVYYEKALGDKPYKITLEFTPRSKLLRKITLYWKDFSWNRMVMERSYDEAYVDQVVSILQKRYGKPTQEEISGGLMKNFSAVWNLEGIEILTVKATHNTITITYENNQVEAIYEAEQKRIQAEKAIRKQIEYELQEKAFLR